MGGCTVLYDLSSSYFEGHCCPLAKYGHSRDHREDRPQVQYGLPCSGEGIPVAIEVVEGNTGDPKTIPAQVAKLKDRFGLQSVVIVGDRGMVAPSGTRRWRLFGPASRANSRRPGPTARMGSRCSPSAAS